MIRLLIIGRPGATWAQRIHESLGDAIELDTAALPSAGIRQFEATPPDVMLIVDDKGGERIETLVQAIRNRPLGQLVPIVLISPLPDDEALDEKIERHDLMGWLAPDCSIHDLWRMIDRELGLSQPLATSSPQQTTRLEDRFDDRPSPAAPSPMPSASTPTPGFLLEPLDDPEPGRRPAGRSLFPSRGPFEVQGAIDTETIERKLKDVRHQDYYAILEVRRGAESQTVREAFHRLAAHFDPRSIDFEIAHRYQSELAEIGDALEDAWAVLGDPDLRQPYLSHTLRK